MSGHVNETESTASGVRPDGWFVGLLAGLVSAFLAKWLGDMALLSAILIGVLVFLVYGVLLGMFWDMPVTRGAGHAADGHGAQDHGAHGHGTHGHGTRDHGAASTDHAPVATPAQMMAQAPAEEVVETVAEAPVAAEAVAAVASGEPVKPQGLPGPRGTADNLQEIEGIGPVLEKLCNELGIYHFDQIAAWGAGEIAWLDGNLKGFKGRVSRDRWVTQAKLIRAEGLDAFRIRAKTNDY